MAHDVLQLVICAPERSPIESAAESVILPGAEGVFTVLPGHTPLLASLTSGVLVARASDGEKTFYAIHGGFAEVIENRVVVLADTVESAEDIDPARAEAARERAAARLKQPGEDMSLLRAEMALRRALTRLSAHSHEGY
ncbi:MAG TPA: ATP synthase F1 subunit epsilon [Candidatus Hydrogenedentes bacterium]|nr:ATP synthase F1 subunit epsilon [Candidatus Hydrogenedentota bacterium]